MRNLAIGLALGLVVAFVIGAAAQGPSAQQKIPGFEISEIRFDESGATKRPTPMIPKEWRLVSACNGEKVNDNNLWFQDNDGNIYLIQGFDDHGRFIIGGRIQKIGVKS